MRSIRFLLFAPAFVAATARADLPATGRSPFPILLLHGFDSSAATWSQPRGGEPGFLDHLASFGWVYGGQFDANLQAAQTINQVVVQLTSFEDVTGNVWTLNFDQSASGFDRSNAEAIYKQGRAVRDAVSFIKELTGSGKVILVGHSMGGLAALSYIFSDLDGNGQPDFYQSDVARVVTIGSPVRGTCLEALWLWLPLPPGGTAPNAHRDLALPMPANPNLFLYGGQEIDVALPFFGDVNCNGHLDFGVLLHGLIATIPASPDVPIAFVVGRSEETHPSPIHPPLKVCCPGCTGDGVVQESNQLLDGRGEVFLIDAAHGPIDKWYYRWQPECEELGAYDALVAALDEPDERHRAYPLRPGRPTAGFLTYQENGGASTDRDFWVLDRAAATSISVDVGWAPMPMQVRVTSEGGQVLGESAVPAASAVHLDFDLSGVPGSQVFVELTAVVPPAQSGIGTPATACHSNLASCRQPYVILVAVGSPARVLTVPTPYPTIGAALAAAVAGDTVAVAPGVYLEHGLAWPAGTVLRGNTMHPADVVIDGQGSGRVLTVVGASERPTVLSGLTVQNASGTAVSSPDANITIDRCRLVNNRNAQSSGALALGRLAPGGHVTGIITDTAFIGNTARSTGGAVGLSHSTATFVRCSFAENEVTGAGFGGSQGGALHALYSSVHLLGCALRGNRSLHPTAGSAGALFVRFAATINLVETTLVDNTATGWGGAMYAADAEAMTVIRSSFRGNRADIVGAVRVLGVGHVAVEASDFRGNHARADAGLRIEGTQAIVTDCGFFENEASAASAASGALVLHGPDSRTTGCRFVGNAGSHVLTANASSGGATHLVKNCSFVDNTVRAGFVLSIANGALAIERAVVSGHEALDAIVNCAAAGEADVRCSVIGDNQMVGGGTNWVGCISGDAGHDGNIEADPQLCRLAADDASVSALSPCLPGNNACGVLIGAQGQGCAATALGGLHLVGQRVGGRVELRWYAAGVQCAGFVVWRSGRAEESGVAVGELLGACEVDCTYSEADSGGGGRSSYRVEGRLAQGGSVWSNVVEFAARPAGPLTIQAIGNGTLGGAAVFVRGSRGSNVALDLFDVRGRRIWRTTVALGEEGVGVVQLRTIDGPGGGIASGVYFARAKCGSAERVVKVVFAR